MLVYKALGLLLTYPESTLKAALREIEDVVRTAPLSAAVKEQVQELVEELAQAELLDLQERYVNLFDRTRVLSLHLFEHVHGSNKDRGQAMVDLQTMYSQHGLAPVSGELPDYLPMMCEFLSLLPEEGARTMLGDLSVILGLLRLRLQERTSRYAAVPAALLDLSRAELDEAELREVVAEESVEPPDFGELDRQWQETEVTFGAGDAREGCGGGSEGDLVQLRRGKA